MTRDDSGNWYSFTERPSGADPGAERWCEANLARHAVRVAARQN